MFSAFHCTGFCGNDPQFKDPQREESMEWWSSYCEWSVEEEEDTEIPWS